MAAWSELLARFITDENTPLELKAVDAPVVQMRADASVVEQEWRAMTDVHQFFTLLKRHNLTRQQAFNLVADDLACKVSNSALRKFLNLHSRMAMKSWCLLATVAAYRFSLAW